MAIISATERTELLEKMNDLLKTYNYNPTDTALNAIIDEWSAQKGDLIDAFKKHPQYNDGKFTITFSIEQERAVDKSAMQCLYNWCNHRVDGPVGSMVDSLPEEINTLRELQGRDFLPTDLQSFFFRFIEEPAITISEEEASRINYLLPDKIHAHAGQKRTRVVNKIFTYLNYNKHPSYNKIFAQYSDAMSPSVFKRTAILSLNPMDYLTMSFGNSWSSCHTIDKTNIRNMPNSYEGRYCSGTMSYLLDPSSMVFYIIDEDQSYPGTAPKIHRQMFHYGHKKLIQGRLYPQSNDSGSSDLYTLYRQKVLEIISTIFELQNSWRTESGTCNVCDYTKSFGTHYRDYGSFENCTISFAEDTPSSDNVTIGAEPICIHCGERFNDSYHLDCCYIHRGQHRCKRCGCWHDDKYMRQIDGQWYCEDCVYYCKSCRTWYVRDGHECHVDNYGIVCPKCQTNTKKFIKCDCCGELVYKTHLTHVKYSDENVCDNCIRRHYTKCNICGEYMRNNVVKTFKGGAMACPSCYERYKNATKDDAEASAEDESDEHDEEDTDTLNFTWRYTSTSAGQYRTYTTSTSDFLRWGIRNTND